MKKLAIAGALALACNGPTFAQDMAPSSDIPPFEYHGDTAAAVVFTSDVESICGKSRYQGMRIIACSYPAKQVIVMPNPCALADREFYAKIMCHEMGHVNGWRH